MPAYRTASEEETIALGERIAANCPRAAVVLLIGNLGAGKTTLAKGIVNGLGAAAPDEVSSPTFTLIHEYGGGRVYHIDLYRLEEAREVATLGLDELFDREAVVLIEWGERFPQLMPPERVEIRIEAREDDEREIAVTGLNMSKQPWALILGASSGFGEATAMELARAGMNIFGVHLDRRDKLPHVAEIQQKIREAGREAEFFNCNASDDEMRQQTVEQIGARLAAEPAGTAAGAAALAGIRRAQAAGRRRTGGDEEAARNHRGHHGPLPGVVGAGLPARRAVRLGRPHFRHDVERRHAGHPELRAGERGQGGDRGAHPAAGAWSSRRPASPPTPSWPE